MRLLSTACLLILISIPAIAADFAVDTAYSGTLVKFESDGRLEFIAGETTDLIGSFIFSPDQPEKGTTGVMQVDLRTLKTGIGLRDEHMRENHLETDKYPFAWFELTEVSGLPDLVEQKEKYSIQGRGYFYLHGIKRLIEPELEFVLQGTGEVKVSAKFSLFLDDFEVERPKALFLKLAERIDLEVNFLATTNNPLPDIVLPDWPEKR